MTDEASPVIASRVLAQRVREHRDLHGLTQLELAERLRSLGWALDRSMLARIEACERQVNVDELLLLAVALNTTPALLLTPADEGELMWPTPSRAITANRVRAWIGDQVPLWEQDHDAYRASRLAAWRVTDAFRSELDELFQQVANLHGAGSVEEIDPAVELTDREQAVLNVLDLRIELAVKRHDWTTFTGEDWPWPQVDSNLALLEVHPVFTTDAASQMYRATPVDEIQRRNQEAKPHQIDTAEAAHQRLAGLVANLSNVVAELNSEVAKRVPPPRQPRRTKPAVKPSEVTPA